MEMPRRRGPWRRTTGVFHFTHQEDWEVDGLSQRGWREEQYSQPSQEPLIKSELWNSEAVIKSAVDLN